MRRPTAGLLARVLRCIMCFPPSTAAGVFPRVEHKDPEGAWELANLRPSACSDTVWTPEGLGGAGSRLSPSTYATALAT